jgi:hypothetical protein
MSGFLFAYSGLGNGEVIMLGSIVMIVLGIIGFFVGGNWLVKSAARLASSFGAISAGHWLNHCGLGDLWPGIDRQCERRCARIH